MFKRHLVLAALAVTALMAVACSDSPSTGRAIADVSMINGGEPVSSSVSIAADDNIPMEFRWRPYNNTLMDTPETTPHGDIVIEHYRITWTRDSAGSGVLPSREENTSIFVPVYTLVTAGVRVVTASEKTDPSLAGPPVTMTAHIDFNAREMGTDSEIKFSTSFTVIFTN
ncbi:MAG TPA: hypothetical protein VFH88_00275 [Candidatus Krumholzibacteria bacterium]|nr:hypothetical protein [Candidatus Krumholzibacteria bacterium]